MNLLDEYFVKRLKFIFHSYFIDNLSTYFMLIYAFLLWDVICNTIIVLNLFFLKHYAINRHFFIQFNFLFSLYFNTTLFNFAWYVEVGKDQPKSLCHHQRSNILVTAPNPWVPMTILHWNIFNFKSDNFQTTWTYQVAAPTHLRLLPLYSKVFDIHNQVFLK